MKKEIICVVVIRDNVVDEIYAFQNKTKAEEFFLKKCSEFFTNWSEYTAFDIECVLENGYEQNSNGSVCLVWPQ